MAYLDETGLDYLWGKTKSLVSSSGGGGGLTVLYDNSSGTTGTITCSDTLANYQLLAVRGTFSSPNYIITSWVVPSSGARFLACSSNGVSVESIQAAYGKSVNFNGYLVYKLWGLK